MTPLVITLACVAVVAAALALVLLVAWRRAQAESVRRQEAAETELRALRERLDALETGGRSPVVRRTEEEYVITRLGEPGPDGLERREVAPVTLTAPAFADAVLRETVVQTAALVHGVRRALAPETRNRIRFEMKREVKRSRKARRVEVKEALREYRARHRAEPGEQAEQPVTEGAA